LIRVGVETDERDIAIALADLDNGARATLVLSRHGARALAATLASATDGDDFDADFCVRAHLTTKEPKT